MNTSEMMQEILRIANVEFEACEGGPHTIIAKGELVSIGSFFSRKKTVEVILKKLQDQQNTINLFDDWELKR